MIVDVHNLSSGIPRIKAVVFASLPCISADVLKVHDSNSEFTKMSVSELFLCFRTVGSYFSNTYMCSLHAVRKIIRKRIQRTVPE